MTEIAKIVREAVEKEGVISFAEFMRLALYCPKYGYYEQARGRIGRTGDFYTNVSTGSLFSDLLGFQFVQRLQGLSGKTFQLVEAGANDGQLASDILGFLSQRQPAHFRSLAYWIIEPSARQQARQRATLEHFAGQVLWFDSLDALPAASVSGIIFSNELLDAMPVYRLGWDASTRRWFEWGVTIADPLLAKQAGGGLGVSFVWAKIPRPADFLANELSQAGLELPAQVMTALPHEFILEICPAAAVWWGQAALRLKQGKLLTIDYGFPASRFLIPERTGGTLRAYHGHRSSANLLAQVGEQDLTAHVNFTQLMRAGESAGLITDGLFSQERFLTKIAAQAWPKPGEFGTLTSARLRQFQTLTHPEQLGQRFSVLLQKRA